jgi:hypothetical protein
MISEILQEICELGSSIDSPEGWEFLPPDDRLVVVGRSGVEILEHLRDRFSDSDLCAAGVITNVDGESVQIHPALDARSLLLQKVMHDDQLIDLSTHRGSIRSTSPPCFDISRDSDTVAKVAKWDNSLFVAFRTPDLLALRKLGLPVVGSAGLGSLSGEQLAELFGPSDDSSLGRVRFMNDLAPVFQNVEQIVLVGWSVTGVSLEVPESVLNVVDVLYEAERAFELITEDLLVWQPSIIEIRRFEAGRHARDSALICAAIRESVKCSAKPIRHFVKRGTHLQNDVASSRAKLESELAKYGCNPSIYLSEAIKDYRNNLDLEFVQPIRDEAASPFVDPLDRPLLHVFADVVGRIQANDPLLLKATNGKTPRPIEPGSDHGLEQRHLWAMAIALYRELKRTQQMSHR